MKIMTFVRKQMTSVMKIVTFIRNRLYVFDKEYHGFGKKWLGFGKESHEGIVDQAAILVCTAPKHARVFTLPADTSGYK
jgi:hypothetical protein